MASGFEMILITLLILLLAYIFYLFTKEKENLEETDNPQETHQKNDYISICPECKSKRIIFEAVGNGMTRYYCKDCHARPEIALEIRRSDYNKLRPYNGGDGTKRKQPKFPKLKY